MKNEDECDDEESKEDSGRPSEQKNHFLISYVYSTRL